MITNTNLSDFWLQFFDKEHFVVLYFVSPVTLWPIETQLVTIIPFLVSVVLRKRRGSATVRIIVSAYTIVT